MKKKPATDPRVDDEDGVIRCWTAAFNALTEYRVQLGGLPFHCVNRSALGAGIPMFSQTDVERIEEFIDAAVNANFSYGGTDRRTEMAIAVGVESVMQAAARIEFHPPPKAKVKK